MSERSAAPLIQFGKYLLDGEIATGGMSKVFRARLRGPGGFEKRLVVKQILPQLAVDPNFIRMFVQEANTLVQMSHPNIVPVYELGVVDGVYFLAMELVEGATLLELLHDGPLPEALVAHLGIQICEALKYAHERFSVIHRDVTPRNLVIDDAGHARLLDFGIAAPADQAGRFGSVGYMSPEQARGLPLGPQSDLFSVGTLLFEALTGRPAFLRDTPEATRRTLLEDAPPTIAANLASDAMRQWVNRLLAQPVDARPRTAAEVAKGLRALLSASHPSGVAEELGRRAHDARARQEARALPDSISTSDEIRASTQHTPGNSRILATSPILDQLMLQTERIDRVSPTSHAPIPATPAAARDVASDAPGEPSSPTTARIATSNIPTVAAPIETTASASRLGLGIATVVLIGLSLWAWAPLSPPSAAPKAAPPSVKRPIAPAAPTVIVEPPIAKTPITDAPIERVVAATDAGAGNAVNVSASRAWLVINAVPWAEAKLDGRMLGSTPIRKATTDAGKHTLELSCPPLGRRARVVVQAKAGETLRVLVNLNEDPPRVSVK